MPDTKVVLHSGVAVPTILRIAKFARPDYIVIGSHGHTAAYEMLVGSVAHGVIRKAPCPVVMVPISQRKRQSPVRKIVETELATVGAMR